ncbi:ABC transporter permease [Sporolactobacillus sp. CPB3-1]|uniref:ABC transporter permease n=1 Tax=Sporolactobacillus mangiferae TaxID=2940498 RepID=A0ABT0M865_9BACL|nr:ABC transporter permease [Sporolactobacillus mangiferae]MCL1631065.1 ABC transporter permease [Sporolactobacillus mangiferae]
MFRHVFVYRFKYLIRDRELVFWTFVFPVILASFFYMAFFNINKDEAFHPINVAVVYGGEEQYDAPFKAVIEDASKGKDKLFNLKDATSQSDAEQWLKKGRIAGYFTSGETVKLTIKDSELEQSIMKSFADQYRSSRLAVQRIAQDHPDSLKEELLKDIGNRGNYVKETAGGNSEPDSMLNYFYALIAMACFYGSFWGMKEVTDIQADISDRAARVNTAPVHKLLAFIAGSAAALVILFTEMLLLLAYLNFALHISFGNRAGLVILTALTGSVLGLSFGALISAIVKKGAGMKVAILTVATMIGSFLSGMMYMDMKYLIARYVPFLAWLNPVNLLTDAFYALYYYDSLSHYVRTMGMMCIFILLFCTGTYLIVRRRKYAGL